MSGLSLIPNALSISRIVLAAIFPFLPVHFHLGALTLALVTEYLDGALARRFGWESLLGQLLDPLADRLLFLGAGLTLVATRSMTGGELLWVAIRDIMVALGFFYILFFHYRGVSTWASFRPNLLGKTTTALQYLVFFYVLILPRQGAWIIFLTGLTGIVSAFSYVTRIRKLVT